MTVPGFGKVATSRREIFSFIGGMAALVLGELGAVISVGGGGAELELAQAQQAAAKTSGYKSGAVFIHLSCVSQA
jgi:hypothetical protein